MRGQRVLRVNVRAFGRIIPARAGPTMSRLTTFLALSDHPRACGANAFRFALDHSPIGSSPRVRGQPSVAAGSRTELRIIPARAGPTPPVLRHGFSTPDHPRACGANGDENENYGLLRGSSPRVRGQHDGVVQSDAAGRIIPARAGPTDPRIQGAGRTPDHPRACGAN